MSKTNELPMPKFTKVRYKAWALDRMTPSNEKTENSYFLSNEQGIEISGISTTYYQLDQELIDQGVILMSVIDAQKKHSELFERLRGQVVFDETDQLTYQNAHQFNTGIFLYIPSHVTVHDVLHLTLNQLATSEADFVARILIYVGDNASVNILQTLNTIGNKVTKASIVVEVIASESSSVQFNSIDALKENTSAYINRQADVRSHAQLDWHNVAFNDGQVVTNLVSQLNGENAISHANVIAITHKKQTQGFVTKVINYGRHSVGHIFQRGVILNRSNLIFNGVGKIIKGAKGSDAQQESRVLMLSRHARGDANPLLLIDENDVTAGHAASVGRIDAEQLYYLMSRGLSGKTARKLVIRGFMGDVLAKMPTKASKQYVIQAIESKLIDEDK